MKGLRIIFSFLVMCFYSSTILSAAKESPSITILSENFTGHKSNIAKGIELSDLAQNFQITPVTLENWQPESDTALYITLGPKALSATKEKQVKSPVLAAFITQSEWHQLDTSHEKSIYNAIFHDPNPIKQLQLIRSIAPKIETLGILHSESFYLNEELLEATADSLNLKLKFLQNNSLKNFYKNYAELSSKTDTILFIPDRKNYNGSTIPKAILGNYRQGKFVFGYSKGLVRSGALASTYTNIKAYITDLVESSQEILKNPTIQFERFSKYYSVETNSKVARSLNLALPSNEQLKESLEQNIKP